MNHREFRKQKEKQAAAELLTWSDQAIYQYALKHLVDELDWKARGTARITEREGVILRPLARHQALRLLDVRSFVNEGRVEPDLISRNAVRCTCLRLTDRCLVTKRTAPGLNPYVQITPAGFRALQKFDQDNPEKVRSKVPRRISTFGILLKLAVGAYCAVNNNKLLTDVELYAKLEQENPDLCVPSLDRSRFCEEADGTLSWIHVDLHGQLTDLQLVNKVGGYAARLMEKNATWDRYVHDGKVSFTILSPDPHEGLKAVAAAEGCKTPIRVVELPLLYDFVPRAVEV